MSPDDLPPHLASKIVVDAGGCWRWQGSHLTKGYGTVCLGGRTRLMHRVAYESLVGSIPDGLQLDHLCRVRDCCNPSHLDPVTNLENARRSPILYPDICQRGHPFSGDNVLRRSDGRRRCRACYNAWNRARYQRITRRQLVAA